MENRYWIGRQHFAMAMAGKAVTSQARLAHYDLAGRYSIMAAQHLPFVQPASGGAEEGQRATLRLSHPAPLRPASGTARARRDPD